jgi:hypothetical protein
MMRYGLSTSLMISMSKKFQLSIRKQVGIFRSVGWLRIESRSRKCHRLIEIRTSINLKFDMTETQNLAQTGSRESSCQTARF